MRTLFDPHRLCPGPARRIRALDRSSLFPVFVAFLLSGTNLTCDYPANLFAPCESSSDCPVRHYCADNNYCMKGCLGRECGQGDRGEDCGSCSGIAYCDPGGICRVSGCDNGACDPGETVVSCPQDCRLVQVATVS